MRLGRDVCLVLGAGLLVAVAARVAVPAAPPLYDGVVPVEPYQWLVPPAGGVGGAIGATATLQVLNGQSPLIAVTTPESAPQAQVFAERRAMTLPAGVKSIKVSIEPVVSAVAPSDGHVDGNVYRILVTDDHGAPLTAPPGSGVSIVLRATDPTTAEATIALLNAGTWEPLATSSTGFGGTFIAVVTTFGDFAVILPGPGPGTNAAAGSATGPAPSPGASIATTGPTAQPALPTAPPSNGGAGTGFATWLLGGLAAFVLVGGLVRSRLVARRKRKGYRGAHPAGK